MQDRYKIHKTREAQTGGSRAEIDLGRYWVEDMHTRSVAGKHFNTLEEAEEHLRQLVAHES